MSPDARDPEGAGRRLAQRHITEGELSGHDQIVLDESLFNYAESCRTGDWTLRSALVRVAQPEPGRASAILELIRRCDAALRPYARSAQRRTVLCDRALSSPTLADPPSEPYPDARVTDLARLVRLSPDDVDAVLAGYEATGHEAAGHGAVQPLSDDERAAIPILLVALELDALADVLTSWADTGPGGLPIEVLDAIGAAAFTRLDALGVPRETDGWPPRSRSRGTSAEIRR